MLKTVGDIMNKEIQTVTPWASVSSAANIMKQYRIGGLPVVENECLVGIITSRDVRQAHPNRLVADAMTRDLVVIEPRTSLWNAKNLLEQHQIERLIVVLDNNKVVGIVNETQIFAELGKYSDPMTGLPRAEYLYQKAIELLERNTEISVIFLDINNFGEIDKKFGHVVGDRVLKQVGVMLTNTVPSNGCLCRYAGDEFAFIWSATQIETRELACSLIKKISEMAFPSDDGLFISASAGIAGGRRSNNRNSQGDKHITIHDLINMASLASTKAKREKSQIVVAESMQLVKVS